MGDDATDVGASSEAAVVVRTLWTEYVWLRKHRPGMLVVSRREMWEGERLFDILTVKSDVGGTREVYFDVSACFIDRRPVRPCPYCGEPLATVRAKQCGECFADFHDPANVTFRRGRDHVDRVREESTQRREREASPPGLANPWEAFSEQFRPTQAAPGMAVLRFPSRLSAVDERLFRVGIDYLMAEGCRGVVCHVDQPLGQNWPLEGDSLGILFRRIVLVARFGLRVVLVGGGELTRLRLPVDFENYETEDEAVARLAGDLESRNRAG